MGLIKKQSIQSLIYANLGVLIGFFNSAVIIPRLFDPYQNGLISFTNSITSMFATFFTLGLPLVAVKLLPKFREDKKMLNGHYTLLINTILTGIVGGAAIFLLFENYWINEDNGIRDVSWFFWIFLVVFALRLVGKQFDAVVTMMYNAVIGAAIENVVLKIVFLIGILSFHYLFDLPDFWLLIFVGIAFASPGIVMFFYHRKYKLSYSRSALKEYLGEYKQEIKMVAFYGLLGSLGNMIILDIDRIMLGNMLTMADTGVYSVTFFFGLFVAMPSRSMKKIANVVAADAWEREDSKMLKDIYQKTSITQLIFSSYLFLGVWFCFPFYAEFMRPEYLGGIWVVFYIGLSNVVNSLFGVNQELIRTSKYYMYNAYFVIVLLFLVIGLNYLMIPIWGITGAAVASFIAMVVLNIIRFFFVKAKMDMQPFTRMHIKVLVLGLSIFALITLTPVIFTGFLGILFYGSIITLLYWLPIYFIRPSEDVNDLIVNTFRRIGINLKQKN
ncbi:MAG: O-antigen/teichoic acid export membrane protein [Patiriisocius sp.]